MTLSMVTKGLLGIYCSLTTLDCHVLIIVRTFTIWGTGQERAWRGMDLTLLMPLQWQLVTTRNGAGISRLWVSNINLSLNMRRHLLKVSKERWDRIAGFLDLWNTFSPMAQHFTVLTREVPRSGHSKVSSTTMSRASMQAFYRESEV